MAGPAKLLENRRKPTATGLCKRRPQSQLGFRVFSKSVAGPAISKPPKIPKKSILYPLHFPITRRQAAGYFRNSRAFRLVFKDPNNDSKNTIWKLSGIPPCFQESKRRFQQYTLQILEHSALSSSSWKILGHSALFSRIFIHPSVILPSFQRSLGLGTVAGLPQAVRYSSVTI